MCCKGSAYFIRDPKFETSHLYFIITDPNEKGEVIIVNVTSYNSSNSIKLEQTCQLNSGDHPFIKNSSIVNFPKATVTTLDKIRDGINGGVIKERGDYNLSKDLLERIQVGATKSEGIPDKCKKLFNYF